MMIRHVGFGVVGGTGVMFLMSKIHYSFWKKISPYIFIGGIIITLLVFSPLGFSHGGARRWVSLGFISFQPAELLKFAVIVFLSAWFAQHKDKIKTWKYGLLPFLSFVGIATLTLIKQPDSGTIALIGLVSFLIYWLKGAPWKHIFATIALGLSLIHI